jgi:hypothetical protein
MFTVTTSTTVASPLAPAGYGTDGSDTSFGGTTSVA